MPLTLRCCTIAEYRYWVGPYDQRLPPGNVTGGKAMEFCMEADADWCVKQRERGLCIRSDARFEQIQRTVRAAISKE